MESLVPPLGLFPKVEIVKNWGKPNIQDAFTGDHRYQHDNKLVSHPAQYYNWANIISSYALTQGGNYLGISPDQVDGTTYTGCWSKGRMQVDELWLS